MDPQKNLTTILGQRLAADPSGGVFGGADAGSGTTIGPVVLELIPP